MRKDIYMDVGKLSAQAGHAFEYALKTAQKNKPSLENRYCDKHNAGSKVVLETKKELDIFKVYFALQELDIPCSIVVDQGHQYPPHFTGEPIITGIGIGPCTKSEVHHVLKKFQVYKSKQENK